MLDLMETFRVSLENGNYSRLHELASDGSRIPVVVDEVKALVVALDAKNWTSKAQKWIPNNVDSKKGKLGELREHLRKVSFLRAGLPIAEEGLAWKLECETELSDNYHCCRLLVRKGTLTFIRSFGWFFSGAND